jgi:hypothetical protein
MSNVIYTNNETVKDIAKTAYPSYNGKKFSVSVFPEGGMEINSYWGGGSRDYYCLVNLSTRPYRTMPLPSNSAFERGKNTVNEITSLPDYVVLVRHCIFQGKDLGIRIFCSQLHFSQFLPPSVELSREEKIVLVATRTLKNSYGGRTEIRFKEANYETKIERLAWNEARKSLIEKGCLRKNGSITNEGRNVCPDESLYQLK